MIGLLKGQWIEGNDESALLDVNGVGYEVYAAPSNLVAWASGGTVRAWIYTHVREDALQLFGFSSKLEKSLFLSLLKVNGIGPKMAMGILSGGDAHSICQMIDSGDVVGLARLPKIGRKKAESIILELKGKLVLDSDTQVNRVQTESRTDIASALLHLGYRSADVARVIEELPLDIGLEDGVRRSLQVLSGQI